jgi:formate hydrogenlyase transcriptional activator
LGTRKGAFTGATERRVGRFEAADGGTIFLDEIGELPAETQIALLRVLQEGEFERVGSSHTLTVDVRVLAATNRELKAAVAQGAFREDLFYRLNVVPIYLPPLRDRGADITLLAEYFIERYAKKAGRKFRGIPKKTLDLFRAYDWPGNIRELQNVIETAVVLADSETFSVDAAWLDHEPSRLAKPGVPPVRRWPSAKRKPSRPRFQRVGAVSRARWRCDHAWHSAADTRIANQDSRHR